MLDKNHYVPILKGRDGEFGALRELSDQSKQGLTPLIEIPPIPWDFEQQAPARSIDDHLKKIPGKLESAWGTHQEFFLDFLWIGDAERMDSGVHPINFVFGAARKIGLQPGQSHLDFS